MSGYNINIQKLVLFPYALLLTNNWKLKFKNTIYNSMKNMKYLGWIWQKIPKTYRELENFVNGEKRHKLINLVSEMEDLIVFAKMSILPMIYMNSKWL